MRRCLSLLVLASALLVAASPPVAAQPKGDGPMGMGRPVFLDYLYRPEVLMRHQGAIGLTAEQRTAIAAAVKETHDRLASLQWDLAAKSEAVAKLVAGDKIDVDATLAAATQSIELEGQIKKEHLRLLLQIKNLLTPEQIAKLRQLREDRCRDDRPGDPGDRGHRPPPPPPDDDGALGGPPP